MRKHHLPIRLSIYPSCLGLVGRFCSVEAQGLLGTYYPRLFGGFCSYALAYFFQTTNFYMVKRFGTQYIKLRNEIATTWFARLPSGDAWTRSTKAMLDVYLKSVHTKDDEQPAGSQLEQKRNWWIETNYLYIEEKKNEPNYSFPTTSHTKCDASISYHSNDIKPITLQHIKIHNFLRNTQSCRVNEIHYYQFPTPRRQHQRVWVQKAIRHLLQWQAI